MNANPFAQSPAYWLLHFDLPQEVALLADEYFAEDAVSIATSEIPETPDIWRMEVLYAELPAEADITRRLRVLAEQYGVHAPSFTLTRMEQRNWLEAVKQDFPPLRIARFFVHGSHVQAIPSAGVLPLQIDAGLAFGSGEHATTSGCLLALEYLAKRRHFARVLDVGTGSGILALAAAKRLPPARVIASDMDAVAVRVARDNARINRLRKSLHFCVADGYRAWLIQENAPYDLIFANILARPLMKLARDVNAHLAPGGVAVLSGLLQSQENMVLAAHRTQRLALNVRFRQAGWSALVLHKGKI